MFVINQDIVRCLIRYPMLLLFIFYLITIDPFVSVTYKVGNFCFFADLLHVFTSVPRDLNFIDHTSDLGWKE